MSLKALKDRLAGSRFARNVAVVATGTAGAQAITMAFAPVITRLYGPEAFGVMGAFLAILAIASPLAALSYPIAIVLPKNDSDALGIVKLSLLITVGMTTAASLLLFAFHKPILGLLNVQVLGSFVFLIPAAMLSLAGLAVMQQWLIRKKLFKLRAKIAVANALVINGAKAGLGVVSPVAATLIVLSVLGSLLHALMLVGSVRYVDRTFSLTTAQRSPLRKLATRYRDFPLYRTPQMVISSVSMALPVLILTGVFGPASAGFYTLTISVLNLPVQLIGQSVGDVFFPRINEAVIAKEGSRKLIAKATISLGIIGFLPFVTIIAFGPQLFSFVFGPDWTTAGEYARWVALMGYGSFINRPSAAAIPVLELERALLPYEIIFSALRLGALVTGIVLFKSDIAAVALFSLTGVLASVLLILYSLHVARTLDQRLR